MMNSSERRYDIDWLRVIAIFLLLIYHAAIVFQPWGIHIGFIQSVETSDKLWIPMALINYWRIPLLFFVSGMGVCFALRRRNWKELLIERSRRILIPLLFGVFFIVPIHIYLYQSYYSFEIKYTLELGHLWFLANICIYVLQIIGFAFLDKNYDYKFFNFFRTLLKNPYTIYLFIIPFIIEAVLLNPQFYSLYIGNGHGFVLGMFAFFSGFMFIAIGDIFWHSVTKTRFISLAIAFSLYIFRINFYGYNSPNILSAIESVTWIFAIFGFAYEYLNRPSTFLTYLSEAVYPVYIIHMVFLFGAAYLILPLGLPLFISFIIITISSLVLSFGSYEFVIRRIRFIRPLFGLKFQKDNQRAINFITNKS